MPGLHLAHHMPDSLTRRPLAGVVLWEICTGRVPLRGRMRDLEVPQDCPPEVAALVDRCLDPDPARRPTAQQLVEQLTAAPATPPLTAHRHSVDAPRLSGRRLRPPSPALPPAAPLTDVFQLGEQARPAEVQAVLPPRLWQANSAPMLQLQGAGAPVAAPSAATEPAAARSPPPSYAETDVYCLGI
jgi:serine/threonine protein kinase